jgi:hypothetical protein
MDTTYDRFDEFWAIYPRRVAKQAAIKAYRKALKLATPADIIAGARRYTSERQGQDVAYTKHPATWINGGCWEDGKCVDVPIVEKTGPIGFYANFTSPELEAWEAYGKATRGRGYPRDKNGGWYFPSRWPPQQQGDTCTG